MQIETLAVHAGKEIDPTTGSVMPPIHLSTTYQRGPDGDYPAGFSYIRADNPNRQALEQALTALEQGSAAAAFASGMAAIGALFQALKPGDHVLIPDDIYFGTRVLVQEILGPWGLAHTSVDMTDLAQVRAAMQPNTQLVWVESPSNPLLKITDIGAVAAIAHTHGARCAVDATWPTPILQQTLGLGADFAVHATTKYLGGHSDLLGGAVIAREMDDFFERIRTIQKIGGAVPSPFDCWLLLRGMRTLPYRMRAHCENALIVAQFLAGLPEVAVVHYPGLPSHPGHAIATRQMKGGYGGMLSFQVAGQDMGEAEQRARAVANRVQIFTQATSLGGVESLIEHRASVEGPNSATPKNLLRVSVGLENAQDLVDDLAEALVF